MSFTPEKIPTTKDELNFKVVETYCDLLDKHEKGLITNAQLDTAIRTLIAAVGWALPKETFLMLSDAKIELDESFATKRIFYTVFGKVVIIKMIPTFDRIEVWVNKKLVKKIATSGDNREVFMKVCSKFTKEAGYEEIK